MPRKPSKPTRENEERFVDSLVNLYGPVVREIDKKIRQAAPEVVAAAKKRPMPAYFVEALRLAWWPADFLRIVGFDALYFQPFIDAVRILRTVSELPRRQDTVGIRLPGVIGNRRLKEASDAINWNDFLQTALPADPRIGGTMFPLFGGGADDDVLAKYAGTARAELERLTKELIALLTPPKFKFASARHLRTYLMYIYARRRRTRRTALRAKTVIARYQKCTFGSVHGAIQTAMKELGVQHRNAVVLPLEDDDGAPDAQQPTEICPIHNLPCDARPMMCTSCVAEFEEDGSVKSKSRR